MIRKSITAKLWLLLVSLVIVSILAIGVFLHQLMGSYYYRQQVETMLSKGEMIARQEPCGSAWRPRRGKQHPG